MGSESFARQAGFTRDSSSTTKSTEQAGTSTLKLAFSMRVYGKTTKRMELESL
jgi:hypothetical protein